MQLIPTPVRARIRRQVCAGNGFSVIELMITVALLGIVLATVLGALYSVMNAEAYQDDRTANLDAMRTTLNDMTKLLRQGSAVTATSNGTRLEFDTYIGGSPAHVTYTVDPTGTKLLEQVGSAAAKVVQLHLVPNPSPALFCYTDQSVVCGATGGPTTQWVQITMQIHPVRSPNTILQLDSQVNLRNRTAA